MDSTPERLPRHVAIIMDGNSRWARERGLTRASGHDAGAKNVRPAVEFCRKTGIEALSLYAFSTENWRRSKTEVNALFRIMSKYIQLELENIHKEDIRITIMGRREGLPERALGDLDRCVDLTKDNRAMTLNVAVNYGGRAEIAGAARALAQRVRAGELDPEAIDEDAVQRQLHVPELPDVDLLIRTSGEMRISNFMLWQISYAEIVVAPENWPEFDEDVLARCIAEYQGRKRRFGARET